MWSVRSCVVACTCVCGRVRLRVSDCEWLSLFAVVKDLDGEDGIFVEYRQLSSNTWRSAVLVTCMISTCLLSLWCSLLFHWLQSEITVHQFIWGPHAYHCHSCLGAVACYMCAGVCGWMLCACVCGCARVWYWHLWLLPFHDYLCVMLRTNKVRCMLKFLFCWFHINRPITLSLYIHVSMLCIPVALLYLLCRLHVCIRRPIPACPRSLKTVAICKWMCSCFRVFSSSPPRPMWSRRRMAFHAMRSVVVSWMECMSVTFDSGTGVREGIAVAVIRCL